VALDQSLIIEEGRIALQTIYRDVRQLREVCDPAALPPGQGVMVSDGVIPALLERICHMQALAYGCLFDNGKRSSEAPQMRLLRLERVAWVKEKYGDVQLPELRNRDARNAIAHFDEYCLAMLDRFPDFGYLKDFAYSHRELINYEDGRDIREHCIRVYFIDIDEMYIFGKTIKPAALAREARMVLQAIGANIEGPPLPETA
jgi:hypothetical protein